MQGTPFFPSEMSLLLISKSSVAAIPPTASTWLQWWLRLQVSSLQKLGHPPIHVQSKADGAGWDTACRHLSFHYFLNSLYYIIILYFYSIFLLIFFLKKLMSFHLKWFVQSLEGIWRETAAVKCMPGMLYLIALCDCPSLCSPDLCPC